MMSTPLVQYAGQQSGKWRLKTHFSNTHTQTPI